MLAEERYEKILQLLDADGVVKVSMLTRLFNVSIETIRRDLEYLEKEGLLHRVYGGAVLSKVSSKQMSFQYRESEHSEDKKEIGEIAARFVSEGQSIALNSGTTTLEVAKALKKNFQRLTIITNSLAIVNELVGMEKYTIIVPGGILKSDEFSLVGPIVENSLSELYVDIAFIGVSGISILGGVTDYLIDELKVQKKMVEIAQQVVILADSSKFETNSLLKICDFDKVNLVVTDSKLKPGTAEKYNKHGIEVVYK